MGTVRGTATDDAGKFQELIELACEVEACMQRPKVSSLQWYEIGAAQELCTRYMGLDEGRKQQMYAFDALPPEEKDRMHTTQDYGIYSWKHLAMRPEVPLILRLAAHEICPDKGALSASDREKLNDPEMIAAIGARFPKKLSADRVAAILAL